MKINCYPNIKNKVIYFILYEHICICINVYKCGNYDNFILIL